MPFPSFSQAFPESAFDNLIGWAGINLTWLKSHNCPCVGDTGSSGSFDQHCQVCFGRGFYWDPPTGPFVLLLTLISWIGRNVDMGETVNSDYGMIYQGHPILTIPATIQPLWTQTNTNDLFVESDVSARFQAVMRVGENEIVPAWHILGSVTIAPSGAVVVEDPTSNQPVINNNYTVNGGMVTLNPNTQYPDGYPKGTAYTVEYYSPPVFAVQEPFGGLSHVRPFGQGISYPKRWKLSLLDLWLRPKIGSSTDLT